MDTGPLVNTPNVESSKTLITLLDKTRVKPRAVLWVYSGDADIWRLWIVPDKTISDKHEFYRLIAEAVSKNKDDIYGVDLSDIDFMKDDHPAISGLKSMIRVDGLSDVRFSNNMLNGFFLPDAIILRMSI